MLDMVLIERPERERVPNRTEGPAPSVHEHVLRAGRSGTDCNSDCCANRSLPPTPSTHRKASVNQGVPSQAELPAIAAQLEDRPAEEIVSWALHQFGPGCALVCSFQNCVLIDIAARIDDQVEVIFLDTGSHFPETLAFVQEVRAHFDLDVRMIMPSADADAWPCGTERCCEFRKVAPLTRALSGRTAWMTGVKRVDTPSRAHTPVVEWDAVRQMVKVNPLARWSHLALARYESDHRLPVHPLKDKHYLSIGCGPTTRPVPPGDDWRAGRWSGRERTECGLHAAPTDWSGQGR